MNEKLNELNPEELDKFITALGSLCEVMRISYCNLIEQGFDNDSALDLTKYIVNILFNIK